MNGVDRGVQERRREVEMGTEVGRVSVESSQWSSEGSSAPVLKELKES